MQEVSRANDRREVPGRRRQIPEGGLFPGFCNVRRFLPRYRAICWLSVLTRKPRSVIRLSTVITLSRLPVDHTSARGKPLQD